MTYVNYILVLAIIVLLVLSHKIRVEFGNIVDFIGNATIKAVVNKQNPSEFSEDILREVFEAIRSLRCYVFTAAFLVFAAFYLLSIN